MANHPIPVLGINRGRLGFLTDILPNELGMIKQILDGEYHIEERFLLTAAVTAHDLIQTRLNHLRNDGARQYLLVQIA